MVKIPIFLAPAFAETASQTVCRSSTRPFSSTACNDARHRTKRKAGRDSNKQRGVSALRSTGTRVPLSVVKHYPELPRPVDRSLHKEMDSVKTDADHGLYGFFNQQRTTIVPGNEEAAYGRAWTPGDLIFKSFDELHGLYWNCHLEVNRTITRKLDHGRMRLGYGVDEKDERVRVIQKTMNAIRKTLLQRDRAYQEAKAIYDTKGALAVDQMLDEVERKREEREISPSSFKPRGPMLPMPPQDD